MKTYLQHIIFLTGIITCLSGCIDENGSMTEADFVSKTSDISLTIKGKMQMQYDSRKHQLAFSEKECMFRVMVLRSISAKRLNGLKKRMKMA